VGYCLSVLVEKSQGHAIPISYGACMRGCLANAVMVSRELILMKCFLGKLKWKMSKTKLSDSRLKPGSVFFVQESIKYRPPWVDR